MVEWSLSVQILIHPSPYRDDTTKESRKFISSRILIKFHSTNVSKHSNLVSFFRVALLSYAHGRSRLKVDGVDSLCVRMRRWKVMTEKWDVEEEVKHRTFLNFHLLLLFCLCEEYTQTSSGGEWRLHFTKRKKKRNLSNILNIFRARSTRIQHTTHNMQNRRMKRKRTQPKKSERWLKTV